jgi:hypothetical protein
MAFPFLLFAAAVLWRVLNACFFQAHNFSPLMALAFCAGLYFQGSVRRWGAVLALVVSDLLLNFYYGFSLVDPHTAVAALMYWIAAWWGGHTSRTPVALVGGSLLCSTLFYLATNTLSWFTFKEYAPTFSAWLQALTTGLPGYAPTWMFFRNSVLSDLMFTGLFVAAVEGRRMFLGVLPGAVQRRYFPGLRSGC